jgi:hypothetical protein
MPGGYAQRWKDVWEYGSMGGFFGGGSEDRARAETLNNKLMALEDYYGEVRAYLNLDRKAKASPQDTTLKKQLEKTEAVLCSKEMLGPYREAAVVALNTLAWFAKLAQDEINGGKLIQAWYKDVTNGLNEIKSISNDLQKDLEAYVNKTLSTLLALKAVGGTEGMPPAPAPPAKPPRKPLDIDNE